MRQQLRKEKSCLSSGTSSNWDSSKHRTKVKWNAEKHDQTNGKTQDAAEMAVQYEEFIVENPLKFEWIGDAPKSKRELLQRMVITSNWSCIKRKNDSV
jgi:hypothetical protein